MLSQNSPIHRAAIRKSVAFIAAMIIFYSLLELLVYRLAHPPYPETLRFFLSFYVLLAIGFHIYLFQGITSAIAKETDQQRAIAHHNSKMAEIGKLAGNV